MEQGNLRRTFSGGRPKGMDDPWSANWENPRRSLVDWNKGCWNTKWSSAGWSIGTRGGAWESGTHKEALESGQLYTATHEEALDSCGETLRNGGAAAGTLRGTLENSVAAVGTFDRALNSRTFLDRALKQVASPLSPELLLPPDGAWEKEERAFVPPIGDLEITNMRRIKLNTLGEPGKWHMRRVHLDTIVGEHGN
ncbi:hypothetical protein ILYODFUR_009947 [Ilyodon furcidens]|uniref:Uncharacterized protein n=1 Tax=Ilyodon furcidens TaxID=33524 RepID=A0ABV0SKU8_9TELE